MPFVEQLDEAPLGSGVLIVGPPSSGKSTSLATWDKPVAIVSMPGEKGWTSHNPQKDVRCWRFEMPTGKVSWLTVVAEVRKLTDDIIESKEYSTIAIDGLHKYFDAVLALVTNGVSMTKEHFDGRRAYPPANILFFEYLQSILESSIPNKVFTVWEGYEKDDPEAKGEEASKHIMPELPGKAATRIMGDFPCVLYATREGTGQGARYVWFTQPVGRVWGAGLKLPPHLAAKVPLKVPQDWSKLAPYLEGGKK